MGRHPAELFLAAACLVALPLLRAAAAAPRPTRSEKACSLISAADLQAGLGLRGGGPLVGMEFPFTKDATHDHEGSVFTCQGTIGGRYVSVTFGSQPATPAGRKRAEDRITSSQEELRKKGYTINAEESEGVRCWTIAAPPRDTSPSAMFSTTCAGTKGAQFFSLTISANGAADLIPTAKLRALARTAASRLP